MQTLDLFWLCQTHSLSKTFEVRTWRWHYLIWYVEYFTSIDTHRHWHKIMKVWSMSMLVILITFYCSCKAAQDSKLCQCWWTTLNTDMSLTIWYDFVGLNSSRTLASSLVSVSTLQLYQHHQHYRHELDRPELDNMIWLCWYEPRHHHLSSVTVVCIYITIISTGPTL